MPPSAIDIRQLTKRFGEHVAVQDLTLSAAPGELITLLGPSGCGKTTTLRLLAGIQEPDTGAIWLGGRQVAGDGVWEPPEGRRVGMVFQDYALFPHLSVSANIAFGLRKDRKRKNQRVGEMLDLVGLAGYGERMPHELSGGQQQRVALARALAPRPAIVLLDEPFSNLDTALRARMRGEVRAILRAAEQTTLFVTHDQEEALSLSDRVAVIFDGVLAQFATPETIYQRPATPEVAAFIGEANFIRAQAHGHQARTPFGDVDLLDAHHGEVTLMLRPENFELTRVDAPDAGQGVILWREYYGHSERVGLQMEGLSADEVLVARVSGHALLDVGQRVNVALHAPVMAYPAHLPLPALTHKI